MKILRKKPIILIGIPPLRGFAAGAGEALTVPRRKNVGSASFDSG
jgi:hypothetical protein